MISALVLVVAGCAPPPLPFQASDQLISGSAPSTYCGVTAFNPDNSLTDLVAYYTSHQQNFEGEWHSEIMVVDTALITIVQLNLHRKIASLAARDVTGDDREELLVFFADDTSAGVSFYEFRNNSLDCIGSYFVFERDFRWRGFTTWDAGFQLGCIIPRQITDGPRLLLLLGADYGKMPRGMILFDPLTGKEDWNYWLSNKVETHYHFLQDVNGDFVPEIIFGSYGPGNGAVYGDTRDVNGYLQAVSLTGKRIWSTEAKGPNAGIYVVPGPIRENSPPFVIAFSFQNYAYGDSTRLLRINAATGEVLGARAICRQTRATYLVPWRDTPEGLRSYLAPVGNSQAGLFTENLDLLRVIENFPEDAGLAVDLNGDGTKEFVGRRNGQELVILDSALQRIAELPSRLSLQAVQCRADDWARLWLSNGLALKCVQLEPNPRFRNYRLRLWATILGSSTGGFALIALSVYGTRQVLRARRAIRQSRREREQMRAMTALIQTMGHELKTPLDLLSDATFYLERELQRKDQVTSGSLQPYLEDFRYVQRELRDRSAELQKFVGLTALQFTTFDFANLVRHVVTTEFRRPDVVFSLEYPPDLPPITADRQQLQRVIRNLVKNSLKAMKAGGSLTVRIGLIEEKSQVPTLRRFLQIVVQDTGCGIAAEDLGRVFDPNFTRFEGGSGLGLAIVRKAVEDHHGHISVTSELGRGTTVTVSLPLKPEEEL